MDILSNNIPLLKCICSINGPVGASTLCDNKKLNMSQATIGRKLIELEKAGILKKVSNKGRILTEYGIDILEDMNISGSKNKIAQELVELSFSQKDEVLLNIMEIRILLEPHIASNTAANASDQDIEHIENLAFIHRHTLSQNILAHKEDLHYHLAIAKYCGNAPLSKVLHLLLTDNDVYTKFSQAGDKQHGTQTKDHFDILNCIKNRDPKGAENAMRIHLEHVYNQVKNSLLK